MAEACLAVRMRILGAIQASVYHSQILRTCCWICITKACLLVALWVSTGVLWCAEVIRKIKRSIQVDGSMASPGALFLSFGILLLSVEDVSGDPTWELMGISKWIPSPPNNLDLHWRWIFVGIALFLMYVSIWLGLKKGLYKKIAFRIIAFIIFVILFLATLWLMPPITEVPFAIFGIFVLVVSAAFMVAIFWKWLASKLKEFLRSQLAYMYWAIFLIVFAIGAGEGLSKVSKENFAFPLAEGLYLVWVFVIAFLAFKVAGLGAAIRKLFSFRGNKKPSGGNGNQSV